MKSRICILTAILLVASPALAVDNSNCRIDYDPQVCDLDNDFVVDAEDNCPNIRNATQEDMDEDGRGDACDNDVDGDGSFRNEDCDDTNPLVSPDMMEDCSDPEDNNCNGIADAFDIECNVEEEIIDLDGDGFDETIDCDDQNDRIHPQATEVCDDGKDNNCDGQVDENPDDCREKDRFEDRDEDGVADDLDNCPDDKNADQKDTDMDGMGNACDPEPSVANETTSTGLIRGGNSSSNAGCRATGANSNLIFIMVLLLLAITRHSHRLRFSRSRL